MGINLPKNNKHNLLSSSHCESLHIFTHLILMIMLQRDRYCQTLQMRKPWPRKLLSFPQNHKDHVCQNQNQTHRPCTGELQLLFLYHTTSPCWGHSTGKQVCFLGILLRRYRLGDQDPPISKQSAQRKYSSKFTKMSIILWST